jgi:hypothetical protein
MRKFYHPGLCSRYFKQSGCALRKVLLAWQITQQRSADIAMSIAFDVPVTCFALPANLFCVLGRPDLITRGQPHPILVCVLAYAPERHAKTHVE